MTPRERFLKGCSEGPIEELSVAPFLKATACEISDISIKAYCENAEDMARAQLKCARAFDVDSVNVASDVLIEAETMGSTSYRPQNDFPKLDKPALDTLNVEEIPIPDVTSEGRFPMKIGAVKSLAKEEFAVISWVMSAYQLAAQLRGFKNMIIDLMRGDEKVEPLLDKCLEVSSEFAKVLIEEGSDVIAIGNASSSMDVLSPKTYLEKLAPYDRALSKAIGKEGALVQMHICGDTTAILTNLDDMVDIVDVDHKVDIEDSLRDLDHGVIKGNLDPSVVRFGSPENIESKSRAIVNAAKERDRKGLFVFSTGCEVPPQTPKESIELMVESARSAW